MTFDYSTSRPRSWKLSMLACFVAALLLAGTALAKPPDRSGNGNTSLSDLGCGQGEVARVLNDEGEWDCSPALTETESAAGAAQAAADAAQATADAKQTRVLEKCGGNGAMWEILEDGAVKCREIPANTDEQSFPR